MRLDLDCILYGLQRRGGASTYWTQICRAMAADPTIDTRFLLPRRRIGADLAQIERLPGMRHKDLLPTALARYLPCHGRPGAIFHSPYYRIGIGRGVRRVLTVHDFAYEHHRAGIARIVHSAQKRAAIASADAVLCVSQHTRDALLHYHPGFDRGRLFITPHAFDPGVFFPEPGVQPADRILFVGLRGGYKRFDLAIEAVRASPGLTLAIAGPPLSNGEKGRLQARLGGRWQYLGQPDDAGLRRAYAASLALLYPSDHEGFGLPLLEAMACGTAVVTNRGTALAEAGGEAALYSEAQSGDAYAAILSLLRDASTRQAHIARGLAWSGTFRWSNTIALTRAVYALLA